MVLGGPYLPQLRNNAYGSQASIPATKKLFQYQEAVPMFQSGPSSRAARVPEQPVFKFAPVFEFAPVSQFAPEFECARGPDCASVPVSVGFPD